MSGARAVLAVAALLSATPALAAKKPLGSGERIDVGRASVAELMRLPSVGRRKAEAIAAARSRTPFQRVDDLLAVKGVSPAWLEHNRAHLTVSGAGPVRGAPPAVAGPTRSR